MLTSREAFKVGFLSRCVEEGVAPEDIGAVVEKTAASLDATVTSLDKQAGPLSDLLRAPGALLDLAGRVAGPAIGVIGGYGVPAAIAAPLAAGAGAGYFAAKSSDVSDEDVEAIRMRELVEEYRRQSEKVERDERVRKYRKKRKQTGRIFL